MNRVSEPCETIILSSLSNWVQKRREQKGQDKTVWKNNNGKYLKFEKKRDNLNPTNQNLWTQE